MLSGDYLRKEPLDRRDGFWRRLIRNPMKLSLMIVVILLAAYAVFHSHGIIQHIRLSMEREQLKQNIKSAKAEQDSLRQQIQKLDQDSLAVEKVARERYGMVKDSEHVYRVQRQ